MNCPNCSLTVFNIQSGLIDFFQCGMASVFDFINNEEHQEEETKRRENETKRREENMEKMLKDLRNERRKEIEGENLLKK